MPLDVRLRFCGLWGGLGVVWGGGVGWGGSSSASPRNAANLCRFFVRVCVGGTQEGGCGDRIGSVCDEDTCLLPASPPGLLGTALASVKAPEKRRRASRKGATSRASGRNEKRKKKKPEGKKKKKKDAV